MPAGSGCSTFINIESGSTTKQQSFVPVAEPSIPLGGMLSKCLQARGYLFRGNLEVPTTMDNEVLKGGARERDTGFWGSESGPFHITDGKTSCETLHMMSLKAKAVQLVILVSDVF